MTLECRHVHILNLACRKEEKNAESRNEVNSAFSLFSLHFVLLRHSMMMQEICYQVPVNECMQKVGICSTYHILVLFANVFVASLGDASGMTSSSV